MQTTDVSYDPDLPDANAVLASLCCITSRYATHPSIELAELAAKLSRQLMAPEYAATRLVIEVAQRLSRQWEGIVIEQNRQLAPNLPSSALH